MYPMFVTLKKKTCYELEPLSLMKREDSWPPVDDSEKIQYMQGR